MDQLRAKKTTEELIRIFKENDHEEWTEEAFEAIKRILKEERVDLREFSETNQKKKAIPYDVSFVRMKMKFKNIKDKSVYSGEGRIVLTEEGINIKGGRVYSQGGRILIGFVIVFAFSALTSMISNGLYSIAPSIFIIWILLDHVILKKHDITVRWKEIIAYEQDPKGKFIGIDFNIPFCHPIVFKTKSYNLIISELNKKIANLNR